MENYVTLKKTDLNAFIVRLSKIKKVAAPVKRGVKNFVFAEVESAKDIALTYIPTILPPKKYFMPQRERLVEYDKAKNAWNPVLEFDELVIFGVHTCDLAGIQCLNMAFSGEPKDVNYLARKNKVTIIGLECNDYCDEYASCRLVNNHLPNGGCDLFFTELSDAFIVDVNTKEGDKLVSATQLFKKATSKQLDELKALRAKKREIFKNEVKADYKELKPLFEASAQAEVWEDLAKRCIACGNCTNVCPTCYCFDVRDDINLDLNTGSRYRVWDSCQNEGFAEVAGGENFRKDRGQRQLHRYMRKFNYPFDKYNRYFCTGCGRCTRACMAKISLKETINSLVEEKQCKK
ncbi:MAG: 4Fe-4S dicluster domain-containing protein [Candidatus Omnitrophota bacterium]